MVLVLHRFFFSIKSCFKINDCASLQPNLPYNHTQLFNSFECALLKSPGRQFHHPQWLNVLLKGTHFEGYKAGVGRKHEKCFPFLF